MRAQDLCPPRSSSGGLCFSLRWVLKSEWSLNDKLRPPGCLKALKQCASSQYKGDALLLPSLFIFQLTLERGSAGWSVGRASVCGCRGGEEGRGADLLGLDIPLFLLLFSLFFSQSRPQTPTGSSVDRLHSERWLYWIIHRLSVISPAKTAPPPPVLRIKLLWNKSAPSPLSNSWDFTLYHVLRRGGGATQMMAVSRLMLHPGYF